MKRKDRVWRPSPQISIASPCERGRTLRQIAAGAFSRPPIPLPLWTEHVVDSVRHGRLIPLIPTRAAKYSRSLNSFSQPYSLSGIGGVGGPLFDGSGGPGPPDSGVG